MTTAIAEVRNPHREGFRSGFRRDPDENIAEWADRYRVLSNVDSAEPGQWRTSRTPYLYEPMVMLSPQSDPEQVVLDFASQLGKTQMGNNWIGYTIHRSPAAMLMVLPTLEVAKKVSKQRIAKMIESTPVLRARVSEARSRDSGNTMMVKEFEGGVLILTGANSSAGLRSMPAERLFMDEIDLFEGDVDGEGDPVALALARLQTFSRRKVLLTSSPTLAGMSRIETAFKATDRRHYLVPCPHCGKLDWIQWSAGGWKGNDGIHHHMVFDSAEPGSIRMKCSGCAREVEERFKGDMLAHGRWEPTAIATAPRTVGYHLSGLYSPLGWKSWRHCLEGFLESKNDPFKLKTWVNTVLAETWEEPGQVIEIETLRARAEPYRAEVPDGVGALICSVDVQGDRLEAAVKGYGAGEESWLIAWTQLYGDPGKKVRGDPGRDDVWKELDAFFARKWTCESGQTHLIDCAVIDSGGTHTESVYRFVRLRQHRKVFAIRGGNKPGAPLVSKPSTANRYKLRLYTLGVSAGKDEVMSRLHIRAPGPGFIHLPEWVDDEYLRQLTAERAIRRYVKGRGTIREWIKWRGDHDPNEAWDLEVYALGGLRIMWPRAGTFLADRAEQWRQRTSPGSPVQPARPEPGEAAAPAEVPDALQPQVGRRGRAWSVKRW